MIDIGQIWVDLIFLVTSLPIQLYEQILFVPLTLSLVLKQDIKEDDELELDFPPNIPWETPSISSQTDGSIFRSVSEDNSID